MSTSGGWGVNRKRYTARCTVPYPWSGSVSWCLLRAKETEIIAVVEPCGLGRTWILFLIIFFCLICTFLEQQNGRTGAKYYETFVIKMIGDASVLNLSICVQRWARESTVWTGSWTGWSWIRANPMKLMRASYVPSASTNSLTDPLNNSNTDRQRHSLIASL